MLAQLRMVDEAIGWATTGAGVFRTSDGGRTWTSVNPRDGGRTWQHATIPTNRFQIAAFSDAQRGWGFTEAHATAMGVYTVFRTQDGGATWTEVTRNRRGGKGNFPDPYMVTGFTFRNESDGWATGHVRDVPLLWLYRTQDGSATWRQQDLELPAELVF